ncbi:ATP-binding protein [Brevibacillus sp. FSL K6-2834]|uniref:ATP-binding protein n=1 Tax=Brevibacillus sp. FSL K6-2834 TaxID=2954680 RepID=UPI0031592E62
MSTSFLLETYAKRLRLPAIKRVYKEIAHDAAERQIPYEEFLLALLEQEVQQRDANQIASRIKHAKFPSMKTLVFCNSKMQSLAANLCRTLPTSIQKNLGRLHAG